MSQRINYFSQTNLRPLTGKRPPTLPQRGCPSSLALRGTSENPVPAAPCHSTYQAPPSHLTKFRARFYGKDHPHTAPGIFTPTSHLSSAAAARSRLLPGRPLTPLTHEPEARPPVARGGRREPCGGDGERDLRRPGRSGAAPTLTTPRRPPSPAHLSACPAWSHRGLFQGTGQPRTAAPALQGTSLLPSPSPPPPDRQQREPMRGDHRAAPHTAAQSRAAGGGPQRPSMASCASRCAAGPAPAPGAAAGSRAPGSGAAPPPASPDGAARPHLASAPGGSGGGSSSGGGGSSSGGSGCASHSNCGERARRRHRDASRRAVTPLRQRANQRPLSPGRAPLWANPCRRPAVGRGRPMARLFPQGLGAPVAAAGSWRAAGPGGRGGEGLAPGRGLATGGAGGSCGGRGRASLFLTKGPSPWGGEQSGGAEAGIDENQTQTPSKTPQKERARLRSVINSQAGGSQQGKSREHFLKLYWFTTWLKHGIL